VSIAASILPEFDQEMKSTRAMIALVDDSIAGWKPHEKSWTTGELALHLANLPTWVTIALGGKEFDMDPAGGKPAPRRWESRATMLAAFDANVSAARAAIEATPDDAMMVGWSLKKGGVTIFTIPRVAVLRSFVLNHTIHHRGQLSVCLRMRDVPLPAIYGPTADAAS
jgi:uncharacterized damage-inducible protein DinB